MYILDNKDTKTKPCVYSCPYTHRYNTHLEQNADRSHLGFFVAWYRGIDLWHKSHNKLDKYSTMDHFVTEICTCVQISGTKWGIVGYLSNALWYVRWVYCPTASEVIITHMSRRITWRCIDLVMQIQQNKAEAPPVYISRDILNTAYGWKMFPYHSYTLTRGSVLRSVGCLEITFIVYHQMRESCTIQTI